MCTVFFVSPPGGIQTATIPATSLDEQSGFTISQVTPGLPGPYSIHHWIIVPERDTTTLKWDYSTSRDIRYFLHPSVSWYELVLSCCLSASTAAFPVLANPSIVLVASNSVSGRNNHPDTAFFNIAQTILARKRPPKASTLPIDQIPSPSLPKSSSYPSPAGQTAGFNRSPPLHHFPIMTSKCTPGVRVKVAVLKFKLTGEDREPQNPSLVSNYNARHYILAMHVFTRATTRSRALTSG